MWPNQSLNILYDEEQRCVIKSQIKKFAGLKILDVGCGTGRLSRWLATQGATVTGIDFSEGALNIAKKKSKDLDIVYRRDSVFDLTDSHAYELVFTWGVLTIACRNREDLLDALKRIKCSLRPKGCLLLMEPIHRGPLHRVLNMSLADFEHSIRESGFEIEAVTPLHFWPMRVLLAYIPLPMWITAPAYHLGQRFMKFPGLKKLGDYHTIIAKPINNECL